MAQKALCAALLVLGMLSVASAARNWDLDNLKLNDLEGLLRRRGRKDIEGCRAIVSISYEVPERLHDEFIDRWKDVEKGTFDEKGMEIYDLKKSVDTNTRFYTYGEWETMEDWIDHMRADYAKDFLDFVNDNDILMEVDFFKTVTEEKYERGSERRRRNLERRRREQQEGTIFFAVDYHVPPSAYDDFIDAWTDVAKDVWEEDGNINYSLKKYALNNHHWAVYGAWESMDDYLGHTTTKHYQRLHEFLADNDITFEKECLQKFGKMKE